MTPYERECGSCGCEHVCGECEGGFECPDCEGEGINVDRYDMKKMRNATKAGFCSQRIFENGVCVGWFNPDDPTKRVLFSDYLKPENKEEKP